jgi:hypothetical protein
MAWVIYCVRLNNAPLPSVAQPIHVFSQSVQRFKLFVFIAWAINFAALILPPENAIFSHPDGPMTAIVIGSHFSTVRQRVRETG